MSRVLAVTKKSLFKIRVTKQIMTAILLLSSFNLFAQQTTVSGTVTSETGTPLTAVSVTVKGSSRGTSTNPEGRFTISVPSSSTLIFSSIGYINQEVPVAGKTTINITLANSNRELEQVVVIGYGTANKRDLTGSIVKISGREVADRPNTNPVASLQGKVSGLSIVNSGQPGQEPDIRIRGTISRYQTKPLYVVDGLFNDNINFINPADIESIEVLKDPSSLAIFGVRGANGVIIVSTKKGRVGQTTVNFNSTFGVKKIVDKIALTDAAGFKTLYNEQRMNQGDVPFSYYSKYQGNSDWINLISKHNPIISTNNISITSGTEKNRFYMGLGYIKEQGLIKYENLDKMLLNISDELRVSKGIKIGFTMNGYRALLPQLHDFSAAVNATPIVEAYNTEKGVYNKLPDEIGGPQIGNPLMGVEETRFTNLQREYRGVGSIFGEVTFLHDFTFRSTFYADLGFNNQRAYTPIIKVYAADAGTVTSQSGFTNTGIFQRDNTYSKFQQEYLLTFKKNFGDHGLTAMGGFTTYYNSFAETSGSVRQQAGGTAIPNDRRFWYLNNFFGDPTTKSSSSDQWEQTTVSYLARALYNYKSKYLLNASFRRDGSSEISPQHRFQNFVAVGAGWELTRENFMKNQRAFDLLKLKASWGILGNQYVGIHYPFYPQLQQGSTAVFGNNIVPAYVPAYLADANLQWETVTSAEAGIELTTFKNQLRFEANYYHKLTKNLLTTYPAVSGTAPGITNAGQIENRGVEASASWNSHVGNGIGYSISANITTLHNNVKQIYQKGFEIIEGASRTTEGFPIGYFFGYVNDGIYQSKTDKTKSPDASSFGDYGPGDIKYKDLNGDGKIDDKDRTFIGNPTPDFTYGFSLSANYKGFDVGIDMQGVYGNEIFRDWGNGSTFAQFNFRQARLDRWTAPGTSNWEPELNDKRGINKLASTYMIEDGSYFRIRNLQAGYNFASSLLAGAHIKSLRLFVNAQNLKTFKNNSGFTPEFGGSALQFGVDRGSYPVPAIYSAGVNVTF